MSINKLIDGAAPQAANAALGAAKDKADEAASKVLNVNGGWGDAKKLLASGKDKLRGAADFFRGRKRLENKGLSPEEVDAEMRRAGKAGEGTALDRFQNELNDLAVVDEAVSAVQLKQLLGTGAADDLIAHKVKLVEKGVEAVIFEVMPEVVENRTVEYEAIAPPQYPTAFQKYKGTSSPQWTVQATLTCRNSDEATENLRILNVLRGWTMPFFGDKIKNSYPDKLGAPPPVLEFSGWKKQMVGPVQVVITSLNWNFPQDVDYIPARGFIRNTDSGGGLESTGELIPFPTVIKISIQLVESFSTDQINGFDLSAFRTGNFDTAFAQTLSIELQTGRSSATGLSRGGARAAEEAQTVAGNPLSDADRAALNAADEFGTAPVSEAPSLGDGTGPDAQGPTNVADGPPPPPAPPQGIGAQAPVTLPPPPSDITIPLEPIRGNTRDEQAKNVAQRIDSAEKARAAAQREYDRLTRAGALFDRIGLTSKADEAKTSAASALEQRNQLEKVIAFRGQQYEMLRIPQGDEGE